MINISPSSPSLCPAANICAITAESGPACGSAYDQLPALVPAEQLCPRAIAGAIELEKERPIETRKHRGRAEAGRDYRLGSLYTELALSPTNTPKSTEAHLETAREYLDTVVARGSHLRVNLDASLLRLYLPVLRLRNFRSIPRDNVEYLQSGLLDMLDDAREHNGSRENDERLGMHLLYAREQKIAFPASARETGLNVLGHRPEDQPHSHSLYVLDDSIGVKIPHRLSDIKPRTDTMSIMYVRFGKVAKQAMDSITPNTVESESDASKKILNLLYEEAAQNALRPKESRILDKMTDTLRRMRKNFTLRQASRSPKPPL